MVLSLVSVIDADRLTDIGLRKSQYKVGSTYLERTFWRM